MFDYHNEFELLKSIIKIFGYPSDEILRNAPNFSIFFDEDYKIKFPDQYNISPLSPKKITLSQLLRCNNKDIIDFLTV